MTMRVQAFVRVSFKSAIAGAFIGLGPLLWASGTAVEIKHLPLPDPSTDVPLDLSTNPATTAVEPGILSTEAEAVRGVADFAQEKPREALKKLTEIVTPDSSAMLDFIIGNLNFQLDEHEEALKFYEAAVRKAPNFAKAYKNLGYLALQSEKLDEALKAFIKAAQLGNEEGAVFGLISYIYLSQENFLSAESAYRIAIMKMPANVDWKLGIGRADLAHQKNLDVINVMGELISADPSKRDYWLVQANSFLALGDVMDAAYDYEIMARLGMGDKETFQALGNIYVSQNKPTVALIAYMAGLDLKEPLSMDSILGAAEVMGARGAIEEATKIADRVEEIYGRNADKEQTIRLLKLQSQLAIARQDDTAAEGYLERLVKLDESDGQTMLLLADFYGRSGEYDKAESLFKKAEAIPGSEADACVKHAQMLVGRSDYEDAIPLLEKAVEILGKTDDTKRLDNVHRYLEAVRRFNRNTRF